jgi:small conductance mechanosensitive channel
MGSQLDIIVPTVIQLVSTWGIKVVGAVLVLIGGVILARVVRRSAETALRRSKVEPTLIPYLTGMIYYLLLAFVVIAVLQLFGIETTSMIAVLGALGFAIGLALQGTLSNFSSGVMLLVFRPFKGGDFIEVAGVTGKVAEIGIFSTMLNTPDNIRIIVPNASVYGQTIKNFSSNQNRRNDMVVGISYSDSIELAVKTIRRVLESESRVLKEPEPQVAVQNLGDSSVDLVVRPWCHKDDYWPLRFDLTHRMKEELEVAGCNIPFPQRDVHLHQVVS